MKSTLFKKAGFKKAGLMLLAALSLFGMAQAEEPADKPKVLLVASSYGVADDPTKPGMEFDEYSMAYQLLSPQVQLELASPKGGKVEVGEYNKAKPYNAAVLASPEAMRLLANSKKLSDIQAKNYQAVLVLGGKGAMFDLADHQPLQQLLADMAAQQKIIAAVCHGPAALLHVKNPDGSLLLQGKKVAGFSNQEESMFAKEMLQLYPFLLQDGLTKAGALYQHTGPMLPLVVQDGKLITGQNPFSTPALVDAMLSHLELKTAQRQAFPDEQAVTLIQQFLAGQPIPPQLDEKLVDIPLMAIWGYYYLQFAKADPERKQAVQVMELVSGSFTDPQFLMALAQGQLQLGNTTRAVELAKAVLKQQPDSKSAEQLLSKVKG
ncbi:type 1 glutamine amidotransferase domain-containing protein [Rheinheimera faecalis]|uniref:type 1 glutamine amidotransferase domain-containing protein n=1 Tax=Rheinheimera faecalis TaxID=2901141 RepID=UPI001E461B31|nr:type 1 glutamine amidotransferase domain-containing protein [Rheinheimera faecalis]